MHRRDDDHLVPVGMNFVYDYVRQPRHGPFVRSRIAAGMPHLRKCGEMLGAREHTLDHRFRGGRVVFRNPVINAYEIDESLLVEEPASRAEPLNARARLVVRHQLAVRIGATAADFGQLLV